MKRRDVLKLGLSVGALPLLEQIAHAECQTPKILEVEYTDGAGDHQIYHQVNGLNFDDARVEVDSDTPEPRVNLALKINAEQSETNYVGRILLASDEDRDGNDLPLVLGVRYLGPNAGTSDGTVPYVIFNGISSDEHERVRLYYQYHIDGQVRTYKRLISIARNTLYHELPLPQTLASKAQNLYGKNTALRGRISTSYAIWGESLMEKAVVQARIATYKSDSEWKVAVVKPSAGFKTVLAMVTDPVGQLLGYKLGEPEAEATSVMVNAIDQQDESNLKKSSMPSLSDCPFIYVYLIDNKDQLLRTTIVLG